MREDVSSGWRSLLACLLAAAALAATGCHHRQPRIGSFTVRNLQGRIEVPPGEEHNLATAVAIANSTLRSTMDSLDADRPDSELARVNRVADSVRLQVSFNTFRIIDLADRFSQLSEGAFDITVSPLEQIWGFGGPVPAEPPSKELILAARSGVGSQNVQLSEQGAVALTRPTTRLSLDRLARSYALDLSILDMRRHKIPNVKMRFHNSVRCLGEAAPDTPWTADIADPFNTTTNLGTVDLAAALVTVRLYDPQVTIARRAYGHVIDPRSGRPAQGTACVAVLGPTATQAHALAEALVVLGATEGARILPNFAHYEAMIIPDRKPVELWMTKAFSERFHPAPAYAGKIRILEPPAGETAPDAESADEPGQIGD